VSLANGTDPSVGVPTHCSAGSVLRGKSIPTPDTANAWRVQYYIGGSRAACRSCPDDHELVTRFRRDNHRVALDGLHPFLQRSSTVPNRICTSSQAKGGCVTKYPTFVTRQHVNNPLHLPLPSGGYDLPAGSAGVVASMPTKGFVGRRPAPPEGGSVLGQYAHQPSHPQGESHARYQFRRSRLRYPGGVG